MECLCVCTTTCSYYDRIQPARAVRFLTPTTHPFTPPTTQQLYALIARGRDVLAEFTAVSGNFPTVTRIILGKIPSDRDGKMSYVYDQ